MVLTLNAFGTQGEADERCDASAVIIPGGFGDVATEFSNLWKA